MTPRHSFPRASLAPLALACVLGAAGLAVAETASAAACGRISIFDNAPRQKDLHAAFIVNIDGKLPGTNGQTVYRVTPGKHVLEMIEHINNKYLVINDRQRTMARKYKTLTIDVAPNTTYSVAARLNQDHAAQWQDGAYWDPVVWNTTTAACH